MKVFKRSIKIFLISLCLLNTCNITTILAAESEIDNSPRVQSVGYKYITIDGIKYRRLWSYSDNCWLEPGWTPCE